MDASKELPAIKEKKEEEPKRVNFPFVILRKSLRPEVGNLQATEPVDLAYRYGALAAFGGGGAQVLGRSGNSRHLYTYKRILSMFLGWILIQ